MNNSAAKPKKKLEATYGACVPVCRVLSVILNALFYVCIFAAALLAVITVIVFLMNTSVEKMLLPPFMHEVRDEAGAITLYNIYLGNGVRVECIASAVTPSDIKTALYSLIFTWIGACLIIAPAARFLSRLSKNIGKKDFLNTRNPRYVLFTGLVMLVGNPVFLFIKRFYNYYLIKTFVKASSESIHLALGFDVSGIIFGAVLLLIGLIYGKTINAVISGAAKADSAETAVAPVEDENV